MSRIDVTYGGHLSVICLYDKIKSEEFVSVLLQGSHLMGWRKVSILSFIAYRSAAVSEMMDVPMVAPPPETVATG